jgi:hypothetical protein
VGQVQHLGQGNADLGVIVIYALFAAQDDVVLQIQPDDSLSQSFGRGVGISTLEGFIHKVDGLISPYGQSLHNDFSGPFWSQGQHSDSTLAELFSQAQGLFDGILIVGIDYVLELFLDSS